MQFCVQKTCLFVHEVEVKALKVEEFSYGMQPLEKYKCVKESPITSRIVTLLQSKQSLDTCHEICQECVRFLYDEEG